MTLEYHLRRWETELKAKESNLHQREQALQASVRQLGLQQKLLRKDLHDTVAQVRRLAPHIAAWANEEGAEHTFPEGKQLLLMAMQHALLYLSSQGLHLCDTSSPDFLCERRHAGTMDTLAYIGKVIGKLWRLPRSSLAPPGQAEDTSLREEYAMVDGWSSWRRFRSGSQPLLLSSGRQQAVLQLHDEYWGATSRAFRQYLLRVRARNQDLAENYLGADWTRGTSMPLRPETLPPHSGGETRPALATELTTMRPLSSGAALRGYNRERPMGQQQTQLLGLPSLPHNLLYTIELDYGNMEEWPIGSLAVMQEIYLGFGDRLGFVDMNEID
jgi:hypothetical protein